MAHANQYTSKNDMKKNATQSRAANENTRKDGTVDHRHENHGQGSVKHPETDGRLKENR